MWVNLQSKETPHCLNDLNSKKPTLSSLLLFHTIGMVLNSLQQKNLSTKLDDQSGNIFPRTNIVDQVMQVKQMFTATIPI